ncbi:MAG: ABC transporter permease [Candidatus Pelethousia sp.]|nr:ABC transporter permease [Candidatus Pelethousia sp.]
MSKQKKKEASLNAPYVQQEYAQRTLFQETWMRFKKSKVAMFGLCFLLALVVISIGTMAIDIVTNQSVYKNYVVSQDLVYRLKTPSAEHVLGMDELGRDVLMRLLWGARYSLFMSLLSIMVALVVGGFLGAVAGYYGGKADNIIMRIMDVLLSMPPMLLALTVVAALGTATVNVVVAVGISFIPSFARILRASVLQVKEQEYIEAAKAVGANDFRVITKFVIPNSLAPIIVQGTLGVANAILTIASLSFVGLGVQAPLPCPNGDLCCPPPVPICGKHGI